MTPEQKVVSLDTARKLKEAGFPQDTERFWYQYCQDRLPDETGRVIKMGDWELRDHSQWGNGIGEHVAAPDAQEIGEELPTNKLWENEVLENSLEWKTDSWEGKWRLVTEIRASCAFVDVFPNEAEARAAAWLWLKENNLL